ncbi:8533_t:CDS:2, partial [Ambispora gerdemannii]
MELFDETITDTDDDEIINKTSDDETTNDKITSDETIDNKTIDKTINDNNNSSNSDIIFALNKETLALAHKIAAEKFALESEEDELLETLDYINDIDDFLLEIRMKSTESNEQLILLQDTHETQLELKSLSALQEVENNIQRL